MAKGFTSEYQRRYPGPTTRYTDSEALNEVYQDVSNGCWEEPADIDPTSRKAKNTKDNYWKIKEQSGRNGKDWKKILYIEKDWKWFHQKDIFYNTEQLES